MKREREQILKTQLLKMPYYTEEEIEQLIELINDVYNGLLEEDFKYCAECFISFDDDYDFRFTCGDDMELTKVYEMLTFNQMKEIHINMRKYLSNLNEGTTDSHMYDTLKFMERYLNIEVNTRYKHIMDGACDLSYSICEYDIRNYYYDD